MLQMTAPSNFSSTTYGATLSTGALLLTAFTFLYSIFISLSTSQSGRLRDRPIQFVNSLRLFCRLIALLSIFDFALNYASLVLLNLSKAPEIILGAGLTLILGISSAIIVHFSVHIMP
jgi:hypothetical protein